MRESNKQAKCLRPDYIETDNRGKTLKIVCKVCGDSIADAIPGRGLVRHKNYAEIKMQFEDRTCHVTNLCISCVGKNRRNRPLLMSIYEADILHMMRELPEAEVLLGGKSVPRIIAVDTNQKGLR